ncbi:MAG: hypothetical protein KDC27_10210 [Acidobacteria bacterium]|nr:hypothetical protein [Acidobacteriota bacterium]
MEVYRPARQYLPASLTAFALALFSAWCGFQWALAFLPAALFIISAALLGYLGTQPPIEIGEHALRIGSEALPWKQILRVDTTSWNSPLVLYLTMMDGTKRRLVYPGDVLSADRLLRQIRRLARAAALDGVAPSARVHQVAPIRADDYPLQSPRVRLLRTEDEEDVLRIYREMKSAGRHGSAIGGGEDHAEPGE